MDESQGNLAICRLHHWLQEVGIVDRCLLRFRLESVRMARLDAKSFARAEFLFCTRATSDQVLQSQEELTPSQPSLDLPDPPPRSIAAI